MRLLFVISILSLATVAAGGCDSPDVPKARLIDPHAFGHLSRSLRFSHGMRFLNTREGGQRRNLRLGVPCGDDGKAPRLLHR